MNVFKRLLMLSGGGTSVPYDYPDKFAFFADQAVVEPSVLEVLRPSDRLGDFTVVRASDASYTDSSGVIQIALDNVARIDYTNGVAELLTEPQSTNLLLNSVFDGAVAGTPGTKPDSWASILYNGVTESVDDSQYINGLKIRYSVTGNRHFIQQGITIGASSSNTFSVNVNIHSGSMRYLDLVGPNTAPSDLITTYYHNGVQVSQTDTVPLGGGLISMLLETITGGTLNIRMGLGVAGAVTGDVTFDMPQAEPLEYITSYIPTTSSSVTRLQDKITDGGNVNVINSEEGTMFFEGSALFDDTGENRYLSLSDGTENNVINISYNTTGALIQFLINAGGALILSHAQPAVDITTNAKIAVKWKVNDFAIWINGVEVDTVLSGVVPTGLNSVNLSNAVGANYFNTRTRELRIADRALTDEELQNLTTL